MRHAALLAVLAGCSAGAPETGRWDLGGAPDVGLPDGAAGCADGLGPPIRLDPGFPDPTCHTTQPFRGKAPGADRVVVLGGAGTAQPALVGSDGSFCVEVQLTPDSMNTLTFSAVDPGGCPGQSLQQKIEHRACAQAGTGAAAAINAALGATISSPDPDQGDRTDLVDGKSATVVKYVGGWGIAAAGIRIDIALAKAMAVERIIVRWDDANGDGCDYGKEYKLYASDAVGPGQVGDGDWTLVQEIKDGDGGEDSFELSTSGTRHVGLRLDQNGCSGWSEGFALREIEVWATDPATPVAPPDRCL